MNPAGLTHVVSVVMEAGIPNGGNTQDVLYLGLGRTMAESMSPGIDDSLFKRAPSILPFTLMPLIDFSDASHHVVSPLWGVRAIFSFKSQAVSCHRSTDSMGESPNLGVCLR